MNAFLRFGFDSTPGNWHGEGTITFPAGPRAPLPTPTREVREQTRALLDLARTKAIVQMGQASRLLTDLERGHK